MAPLDSTANSFQSIHERLDKIEASIASFTTEVLAKLEAVVQRQQPRLSTGISRRPLVDVNESRPANPDVNTLIEKTLSNPRITNGAQLGIELSKILFTEQEMAASNLTGRRVNGQPRSGLDPTKLKLIENLVKQEFNMSEAEFFGTSSAIRSALSNRCKYLRLKYAPTQNELI
jgi:hypothetical protein